MAEGFGLANGSNEHVSRKYFGEYIVIHIRGDSNTYSGRFLEKDGMWAVLDPHFGRVVKEGKLVWKVVDGPLSIFCPSILAVEKISRELIEGYCKMNNQKEREEEAKKSG